MTVHNHRVLPLSQRGIRGIRSIGGITLSAENRPCFQFTAGRVHRELASRSKRSRRRRRRILRSTLYVFGEDEWFHFRTRFICQLARYPEMIYGTIVRGKISELRVCWIYSSRDSESDVPLTSFRLFASYSSPYGFHCWIGVKYYRINYLTSRNIRNESLFLNLAHDEEEGNLGRIIERRANFLPRSKMKRIPQKISLEAERIAVPLKSSSLNRNDTPIYIYT